MQLSHLIILINLKLIIYYLFAMTLVFRILDYNSGGGTYYYIAGGIGRGRWVGDTYSRYTVNYAPNK